MSLDRALAANTRTDVCLSFILATIDDVIRSHNSAPTMISSASFKTTCRSVPKNQRSDDTLDLSQDTHHNPLTVGDREGQEVASTSAINYDWKFCIFKSQEISALRIASNSCVRGN